MLCSSRLIPILTLLAGGLASWAGTSGRFDSLLQADAKSTTCSGSANSTCPLAGDCCNNTGKGGASRSSLRTTRRYPRRPRRPARSRTSSSSWATTSACGTSAPTTAA